MSRLGKARRESGQVIAFMAIAITAIIAMAAFAIDTGSWYRVSRQAQSAADAAAESAAFDLPANPAQAVTDAQTYVNKNITGATATITTPYNSNSNLIHVKVQVNAPTYFAKIFGINSISVTADSTGSAATSNGPLGTGYWVAPMAVSGGCGGSGTTPCYGTSGSVNYLAYHHLGSCTGVTYSFCWTDLASTAGLTESAANDATLKSWIANGYPSPLTVPFTSGDYKTTDCATNCTYTGGNECGHNAVPAACVLTQQLVSMAGKIILVPVFDPSKTNTGSYKNMFYIEGFAVWKLASSNVWEIGNGAQWWITGQYLGNYTCQAPPSPLVTPPPGYGTTCYGSGTGGSGSNFGVGTGNPIQLTQ